MTPSSYHCRDYRTSSGRSQAGQPGGPKLGESQRSYVVSQRDVVAQVIKIPRS